ncbi:selenocysteine-specific translation elongation factor [Streptomyces swartbergensis]|uniref:Selenocysteine-specific translation elongation factor n=1 Tax=Streptomyces swartbergensis TaxID=487165 RepID=A0A243S5F6_9ACTN|nr:selenocysteine-specific translation elongation factor [Streptomyces swartbergensis]OUD02855.1 selenocysteine-specific translation elongation factor [Streptomyces swartbergensis]
MQVIATAGHVDHGKSTLVRLLTGMEPDRWEQERRRGLTIDLGFAWTTLPGGLEVAFVDVPGHERFVPNMLAGVGPVPAVLFVVAADEGWMPQSTEHLQALGALGVRHVLLAVTRCDLADPEPARQQALARIEAAGLGPVDSVTVSGRTGEGLDRLRAGLLRLVGALPPADPDADVRLWVDRSFSIVGAGTVVTGTLAAGTLRAETELQLASTGAAVRVRRLQTLGRDTPEVRAVARVAVNLRGVEQHAIGRGDALLTPGGWLTTAEVDVALRGDDGATADIGERPDLPRELVLHVGSASVATRIRPLGVGSARLRLARPLPLRVGDRALLRDPGRHRIVAGVDVLDVTPPELRRRGAARSRAAELAALTDAPAQAVAEAVLLRRRFATTGELHSMGLPEAGEPVGDGLRVHPSVWRELLDSVRVVVDQWREDHPLESGVPVEAVRRRLRLPTIDVAVRLAGAASLPVLDGRVCAPGRRAALPAPVEAALAALTAALRDAPFAAPDAAGLAELRLGARELAAAVRAGRLLKVADGVFLLPDGAARAGEVLAELPQPFTLSQARQALRTTRRVAVPLLELLDRRGVTERLPDDTRRMRTAST